MITPDNIVLIYTGDVDNEICWCDSVPSQDIEDADVVHYVKASIVDQLRQENESFRAISKTYKELEADNERLKEDIEKEIESSARNDANSFDEMLEIAKRAEKAEAEVGRLRELMDEAIACMVAVEIFNPKRLRYFKKELNPPPHCNIEQEEHPEGQCCDNCAHEDCQHALNCKDE